MDPRKVKTKEVSISGRAVARIFYDKRKVYEGTRNKVPAKLIKMLFEVCCNQADKIDELTKRITELENTAITELPPDAVKAVEETE